MKLYEINHEIEDLLEKFIDPDTGEILDEQLAAAYDTLQMARSEKIENIGLFIKDLEAEAKAIKEEAKNLTARAKAAENRADSLKAYLQYCLGGEKFKTPTLSVSYRKSQKVEVDENRLFEVPEQYLRYKDPEVDKTAVKKALVAGESVPGCTLVDSVSVIIK